MDERFNAIHEHGLANVKSGRAASCASMITINGETVWHDICGYSDYELKKPLEENAMFRLASMTKPVVGAAVMIQVDRGLLKLDDKASKYIPSFANPIIGRIIDDKAVAYRNSKREILIRDLLTHSSGLGSGKVGDAEYRRIIGGAGDSFTLADIIPELGKAMLDFEPQSSIAYSGLWAFDTLARIVEITSGMSFPEFLNENISKPLGISDLTFMPTEEQWSRVCGIYASTENGVKKVNMDGHIFEKLPLSYTSGGAGLIGSLESYSKFAQMLLDGKGSGKYRILSEKAIQLMRTPSQPDLPNFNNASEKWGLSMRVITGANIIPAGCYGWSGAYGTHFWIDPNLNLVAVYCSNMTTAGGSGAFTAREFEFDVTEAFKK